MYYLLDWGGGKIVSMSEDEQELRDKRRQLKVNGYYDDGELVIAEGVE